MQFIKGRADELVILGKPLDDKLIFSAFVGSLSASIIPFLNCTTTSCEAWTTLANTYAKPTRGHIKQIKEKLKNPVQGS